MVTRVSRMLAVQVLACGADEAGMGVDESGTRAPGT